MDSLLTQMCIRSEMTNNYLQDLNEKMDKLINIQNTNNSIIEALSRVNDTLIATNIDLRKRLGEYKDVGPPLPTGDLVLSNYNGKNLIISGNTFELKDEIKERFQVSWNSSPKGWLCDMSQKQNIINYCSEKKYSCKDQTDSDPIQKTSEKEEFDVKPASEAASCMIR